MRKDNHYNVKRLAHSVSRSSTDQAWNPFRHVSWNRKPSNRADTWDVGNAEEGRVDGGRLRQFATAPNASSGRHPTEASTSETIRNSNVETEDASSPAGNTETTPTRTIPATETDGVRQRKLGDTSQDELPTLEEDDSKEKGKKEGLFKHVQPKTPFTVANQLQRTFLNSWINILILAAPVGIALNYVREHNPDIKPWVVFLVNFIAIVPLAAMLSFATEEIALRTGEVIGGLLNATFGNAVELIIAIIALTNGEVQIVQTSLIGSILSNLLLVLGFCFFFGGLRRTEQYFNTTVAQTAASLLAVAVGSVIVPSVFDYAVNGGHPTIEKQADIAKISRGTAVILLLVYAAYLFFQLKTHQDVFNEESQKVPAKPWSMGPLSRDKDEGMSISQGLAMSGSMVSHGMANHKDEERVSGMVMNPAQARAQDEEEEDEEEPQLHFFVALATLGISTAIIALCAEAMVGSIDELTTESGMSKEFVGLILLPIVGNAAEHATAVTVAMKDKMDLAIGVAVGSSMQVALFLIPLLVIIGWGLDQAYMDLSFDMFQVAVLFVAVLLVNYLIGDGKSHWLEGYLLICLYAIIAVCTFCKSTHR